MNVKAVVPLVAGLGIGGFALKIGVDTLQKAKGAPAATISIWTAKADIRRGTLITEEMLKTLAFPAKLAPSGAIKDKAQVVGRVPRVDAPAGLPILTEMLLPPGAHIGVHVPPGFRAVAVKIDESSGVDFHLDPGSHVDVVGYFTIRDSRKQETIARTLIENVEVAAVGARVSSVGGEGEEKGARPTRAVTLLVKPDAVPILHLAEQKGKIKLSMRGLEDDTTGDQARSISDDEVIRGVTAHASEPELEPAPDEENASGRQGGLIGVLTGMFNRAPSTTQPAPVLAAAAVATPTPPADPAWIVHIWRGNNLEVIRFKNRDSRQRLGEGEPEPRSAVAPASASAVVSPYARSTQEPVTQTEPGVAPPTPPQEQQPESQELNE